MRRYQYRKPSHCHRDRDHGEQESMLDQIAEVRHNKSKNERGRPWGHRVQLRLDGRVAICPHDLGRKEGVAVGWDDEAKVHKSAKEDFEIFEDVDDVLWCDAALEGGTTLILFEPGADVGLLGGFQPVKGALVDTTWSGDALHWHGASAIAADNAKQAAKEDIG